MPNLLIVGCGYIGTALAEMQKARGVDVFGVTRSGRKMPKGVKAIRADVSQLQSLDNLPETVDLLVYCVSADAFDEDAYRAAYVTGLQNTLRALAGRKIKRFIYVSSTGVYGQDDGEIVDELSETQPKKFSGQILLDGEERALRSGLPTTIVRFSGIYGPGRSSVIKDIRNGTAYCYLGVSHSTNRIHRDDCAGIIDFLLSHEGEIEAIYVGSDEEPVERNAFLLFLAACMNKPAPAMLPASEAPPRLRSKNKRCNSRRIRELGYSFRFPTYKQGYLPLCQES